MEQTRSRLEEASFFLQNLEESAPLDFNHYLNAYVTSARSVLWVMRSEYSHIDGYDQWFNGQKASKEEQELMKNITDLRNESQKRAPLQTGFRIEFQIPKGGISKATVDELRRLQQIKPPPKLEVSIYERLESQTKGSVDKKGTHTLTGRFEKDPERIIDGFDRPIIDICKSYQAFLEKTVSECHTKFG